MCLCFRRRKPSFQYRPLYSLDTLPGRPFSSSPRTAMGVSPSGAVPPPAMPPRRQTVPVGPADTSPFTQQRERLVLELLPFKDAGQFHEWLRGGPVQGAWGEFQRDLLARAPADHPEPDPDKARTAQAAKDAINGRSQKFLVYHPDKAGWAPEDHYVRFIAVVISDSLLANLWSESDWKKRNIDICKAVYEVLFFLKASHYMNQQAPPCYTD